eukprot:1182119-Prorocentrum_minimum.AAC.1
MCRRQGYATGGTSVAEILGLARIFLFPFHDWCPLRVYSYYPSVIGARYGYFLSPLPRLVLATTMCAHSPFACREEDRNLQYELLNVRSASIVLNRRT